MRITALSRARYNCEASSMAVREWNWIPDIWGVGCSRYMRGAPSNPPPPLLEPPAWQPSNTPPPPLPPRPQMFRISPPSVSTQESSCRAAECALHRCKVEKYILNTPTGPRCTSRHI